MAEELELTCVIRKEGNVYSSICPELNVVSQGKTPAEAKKRLIEAVEGYLIVAKQEGMLDEIFERVGMKKGSKLLIRPISVPLPAE